MDGEPGFVGLVGVKSAFVDVEIDAARDGFGDLIVAGNEGLKAAAGDQEMRDAVGLIGRFNKEFADTANVVGLSVVGGCAHQFGGVDHEIAVNPFCRQTRADGVLDRTPKWPGQK